MIVGTLTVELLIPASNSLKDKRQVVKSLLDSIRRRYNISAAELEELDTWRRAVLGFACISNDRKVANSLLDRVLRDIESEPRVSVTECHMEFL